MAWQELFVGILATISDWRKVAQSEVHDNEDQPCVECVKVPSLEGAFCVLVYSETDRKSGDVQR